MKNIKLTTIVLVITNLLFLIGSIVGSIFAYRLGYCKSYDDIVGASECKPSRKWM